jgi:hypothetical protein
MSLSVPAFFTFLVTGYPNSPALLIFDSQGAPSVIVALGSRPAMILETLENFLFLLLWVEVFAMAIGLLLLDRSMSQK